MYYIVIDGVQHGVSFQWEEALIEAAQCDFELNAPELNNGIQGTHDVQILSFQEMMESDVVMVIWPGVSREIESPTQHLPRSSGIYLTRHHALLLPL